MITYESGTFGLTLLRRTHGSALYKAILPSLLSTICAGIFNKYRKSDQPIARNADTIALLIVFFSLLLTFRLNYAYQRYWEGASAIHLMLSKWLDAATHLASFHMQSAAYNDIRPPTFGAAAKVQAENDRVKKKKKKIRHFQTPSMLETTQLIEQIMQEQEERSRTKKQTRTWWSSHKQHSLATEVEKRFSTRHTPKHIGSQEVELNTISRRIPVPLRFQEQFTLANQNLRFREKYDPENHTTNNNNTKKELWPFVAKQGHPDRHLFESTPSHVPIPSLFLQEMAHLFSLLAGVAMSTLRNDLECAEIPLVEYFPGKPWPHLDPDADSSDERAKYNGGSYVGQVIDFVLSLDRSEDYRTLYNAARPFAILGGVSDSEVELLHRANGPYAKMSLCTLWLQEFVSRECLNGSTGDVASPHLSRVYQFISDGAVGYNNARKVAYVPFPFPHDQMIAFFSLAILVVFPLLFATFVTRVWMSCLLNFATTLCFMGLHEVALELENPFVNTPNDLPLLTFQAQFNEALVTVYAGFHPDSWDLVAEE